MPLNKQSLRHKSHLPKRANIANVSATKRHLSAALLAYLQRHVQVFFYSMGRLWRTPGSTLMTASVIGIALAMPAGLYLILNNIQDFTGNWRDSAQISLFLKSDIDHEQALAFAQLLQQQPSMETIRSISRTQALTEFRRLSGFGGALDILDTNPLPEVLVIHLSESHNNPASAQSLMTILENRREVEYAQLDMQWVKRLYAILLLARRGVFIIAALLSLAVLLIIGNTIRLEIHNHQDEIKVTKLIGATNAFIRRPFLYNGILYGILGGMIAWILLQLCLLPLIDPVQQLIGLYGSDFSIAAIDAKTTLAMFTVSTMLGLAGSWLAVGRHLDAIEPT